MNAIEQAIEALESAIRTYEALSPGVITVERRQCVDAITALQSMQGEAPNGYVIVRDTTESMSTNRLSDKLQYWRAMRPDEWTMDEFIHDAQVLEAKAMLTASGKGE